MAVDYSAKLNTESIQREAILVLFTHLNTKIASLQSAWTAADNTFWAALGRGTPGWTVETVPIANFHAGAKPSLMAAVAGLETPDITAYPNVVTFAYRGDPRRSNDDTGEIYTITLSVEIIVKSVKSEEECNNRIQKTLEAAHLSLLENRDLNNTIIDLPPPLQSIGDLFVRLDPRDSKQRWYFQGGVLQYSIDKYIDFY